MTKGLGVTLSFIEEAELYTAAERGIVQGFLNTIEEHYPLGYHEVAPYVIDQPVMSGNVGIIMNLEKWDKLPEHLRNVLTEARLACEPEWKKMNNDMVAFERERLLDAGMTFIKFSPEDEKWLINTYFEKEWAKDLADYPESAYRLKTMVTP